MHRLSFELDRSTPNYPKVRALIDGDDRLAAAGAVEGNDPADILDTGALLPSRPPRRVAFYGCSCGEFGCSNVAGLIVRRHDHIEWTDFHSITGVYRAALPEPEDGPDPLACSGGESDLTSRPLDLPTFTFDATGYLATVERAMADRSWETRPRAVMRHLRSRRPGTTHWASLAGESITLHHRMHGRLSSTELSLPPGPPDLLADSLIALLDAGKHPRAIAADGLWK